MVQEQRKLKEILKQRGISAYRLAIDCHIATTNIYNCLNGKQYMYPKWRKTIAEYLNMSEKDLFNEEGGAGGVIMTKLRTIEGAYLEIKEQDPKTAITKHSIRQAVTSGAVPSKKAGRKYLVNVDCVIAYFSDEEFEHIRGFINSPNNRIVERR